MNICVIPARGGSKRIPRKNIKVFCGKPIIAYSIEAALNSDCFDRVIVSTDDTEIAKIAKNYGAEVPFVRPFELANDFVGTKEVISHAISALDDINIRFVCCLYPTAALVLSSDLKNSQSMLLVNDDADFCLAVTDYAFPIQRALKVDESLRISMLDDTYFNTRSQDLVRALHDAGQFCWGKSASWLNSKNIINAKTLGYLLPRYRVQDIDTFDDWQRAELIYYSLFRDNK